MDRRRSLFRSLRLPDHGRAPARARARFVDAGEVRPLLLAPHAPHHATVFRGVRRALLCGASAAVLSRPARDREAPPKRALVLAVRRELSRCHTRTRMDAVQYGPLLEPRGRGAVLPRVAAGRPFHVAKNAPADRRRTDLCRSARPRGVPRILWRKRA